MDVRITKGHFETYKLVNTETSKVEDTGLGYSAAKDAQNHLAARGIWTTLVKE